MDSPSRSRPAGETYALLHIAAAAPAAQNDAVAPSPSSEEACGICLETLTNPVTLPCAHEFCSECLNGWRSKYSHETLDRKCPLCRETIPLSKEILAQLHGLRYAVRTMEERGEDASNILQYATMKHELEILEEKVQGRETEEALDDGDDFIELPHEIGRAAGANNIRAVVEWLGPPPVDKKRLNAKDPMKLQRTLLHEAVFEGNLSLISILLQCGANVDPISATGRTPLMQACDYPRLAETARLLLQWGAENKGSGCELWEEAEKNGNKKLARLLKSEFGGRRCEIMGMEKRTDLNGITGVAEKYLEDKNRYKVVMEYTGETFLVSAKKLKRRDRTPRDCGYFLSYLGGEYPGNNTIQRNLLFASAEEKEYYLAHAASKEEGGSQDKGSSNASSA